MPKRPKRKRANPPRKCIFCGAGNISGEHFWSDWIAPLLPKEANPERIEGRISIGGKATLAGPPKVWTRQGPTYTTKVRAVCVDCNSGWMSRLEMAAQPILTPLILGKAAILKEAHRRTIVQWAAMKFMVAEHFERDDFVTPEAVRFAFKQRRTIPDFFKIWIASCGDGKWRAGVSRTSSLLSLPNELPKSFDGKNSQSITWGIGKLLLHTTATTIPNLHIDLKPKVARLIIRIWPHFSGDLLWPPPRAITNTEADLLADNLNAVTQSPGVLHMPKPR